MDARTDLDGALAETPPVEAAKAEDPKLALGSDSTAVGSQPPSPLTTLPVGHQLSRYVILGVLGRGGMGAVYSAFDPDLDRKIAIKLLRQGIGTLDERARLMREAQALARVTHPGVVAVHDVGTIEDRVFLAMELVAGGTLRTWVEQEPRTAQEVVQLVVQAARGLAAAHAAGLVHRDIKPDNILVDATGRARIGDFGLAFAVAASRRSEPELEAASPRMLDQVLTATGALVGTPAYMAPEQIEGDPVTVLADQFSLCVTLYEALYGVRPFQGNTLAALAEAMRDGAFATPPQPRQVPPRIRDAVRKGLAFEPSQRHASIDVLVEALERGLRSRRVPVALGGLAALVTVAAVAVAATRSDEPSAICRVRPRELAGTWSAPRLAVVASSFAATRLPFARDQLDRVVPALDGYASAWIAGQERACEDTRIRKTYDEATLALRTDCFAARRRELGATVDLLARADVDLVTNAVDAVARLSPLDQCDDLSALREVVRPPTNPAIRAQVDTLSTELAELDALHDASRLDEHALRRAQQIAARAELLDYPPIRAEALHWVAVVADDVNALATAEQAYRAAILAADVARNDRLRARNWSLLVMLLAEDEAKPDDARAILAQAEAAVNRVGEDPEIQIGWLNARASLHSAIGEPREAAALLREVLDRRERDPERSDALLAAAIHNVVYVTQRFGKPDEVLALARRGVEIARRAYGDLHPETAGMRMEEGVSLLDVGDYKAAVTIFEDILRILETTRGPGSDEVAQALVRLGSTYRRLERFDDAIAAAERALAIRKELYAPDHPVVAEILQQLALVTERKGDLARALAFHREALRIVVPALGEEHPFVAVTHFGIGKLLYKRKEYAAALVELERSLAIEEKRLGHDAPQLAESLTFIGSTKLALGDTRAAVRALERALALRSDHDGDPLDLAQIQLTLANALRKAGGDTRRTRELATSARSTFAAQGKPEDVRAADTLLEALP